MNQGYLRMTVLEHLSRAPCSGYALVKAIHERSGWKPSFGSIYPLLERLESEGLVTVTTEGRSKVYRLTESGLKKSKGERETRSQVHGAIIDQLKVLASMGDEDAAGMVGMFERQPLHTLPFFHLPEFSAMRKEIHRIVREGKTDAHLKELKTVFVHATKSLKEI